MFNIRQKEPCIHCFLEEMVPDGSADIESDTNEEVSVSDTEAEPDNVDGNMEADGFDSDDDDNWDPVD